MHAAGQALGDVRSARADTRRGQRNPTGIIRVVVTIAGHDVELPLASSTKDPGVSSL